MLSVLVLTSFSMIVIGSLLQPAPIDLKLGGQLAILAMLQHDETGVHVVGSIYQQQEKKSPYRARRFKTTTRFRYKEERLMQRRLPFGIHA